jgi:hypothetical protein
VSDEVHVLKLGGEEFRVRAGVPLAARMRFAHVTQKSKTNDWEQLDAVYRLCRAALHPDEDFDRFLDVAERDEVDQEELSLFVRKVMTGDVDFPTSRPSGSSDGPSSTEQKSESVPASEDSVHARVIRMHEKAGRPDKALLVLMAQEQQQRMVSAG